MRLNRALLLLAAGIAPLFLGSCSRNEPFPVRTYHLGQSVRLGDIGYTVYEAQWMIQLGEGATARLPQSRFFLVRLSATNGGTSDTMIPNVTIEDDNGKSYEELKDGQGVPQWIGYLRAAKPSQAVQGNVVFDVPPAHYKLRVTDESGDRAAFVDIPLSFGAEAPDIAIPTTPKKD